MIQKYDKKISLEANDWSGKHFPGKLNYFCRGNFPPVLLPIHLKRDIK